MQFYLALKGTAAGRYARINGAVVIDEKGRLGGSFMDVISIGDWIVLGPNRIEVELSPVGGPARVELLLAAKSGGGVQTIRRYATLAEVPSEIEFQVGPPMEGAPESEPELDDDDRREIGELVVSLRGAIAQGRIDDAIALLRPRLDRIVERQGIDPGTAEALQRQQLEAMRDEGLTLLPVSADGITLTPVCRGGLVRAEVDGRAPIYAVGKGDSAKLRAHLPLTFRRGPNGWIIAR